MHLYHLHLVITQAPLPPVTTAQTTTSTPPASQIDAASSFSTADSLPASSVFISTIPAGNSAGSSSSAAVSTTSAPSDGTDDSHAANSSQIVGAVLGGIAFLVLLVLALLRCRRRIRGNRVNSSLVLMYASSRYKPTDSQIGNIDSHDESIGIGATFYTPLPEKVGETRAVYNEYVTNT